MGLNYPFHLPIRWLITCRSIDIHLLNLLDGSPHPMSRSDVISLDIPLGTDETRIMNFAMTGSRLMIYVSVWDYSLPDDTGYVYRVVLWDWRSGDLVRVLRLRQCFSHVTFQVFDRSSTDESGLIKCDCQVTFLDEFRIVVSHNKYSSDDALTVFNTLVPKDDPRSFRRFRLPPKYLERDAYAHLDRGKSLRTASRDGHLVDPTQAILVISISAGPGTKNFFSFCGHNL